MNKEDLFRTYEDHNVLYKAVCSQYNNIDTEYPRVTVSFIISVSDVETDLHLVDFYYLYCCNDEELVELQKFIIDQSSAVKILETDGRFDMPFAPNNDFAKDLLFKKVDYMTEYYKEKLKDNENIRRFNDHLLTEE